MQRVTVVVLLTGAVAAWSGVGCVTQTRVVSVGTLRSVTAALEADGEAEVVDGGGERLVLHTGDPIASLRTLSGDANLPSNARLLGDVLALCRPLSAEACPLRRATAMTFARRGVSWPLVWMYTALVAVNGVAGFGGACAFGALGCDDYSPSTRGAIGVLSVMAPLTLVVVALLDSMGP